MVADAANDLGSRSVAQTYFRDQFLRALARQEVRYSAKLYNPDELQLSFLLRTNVVERLAGRYFIRSQLWQTFKAARRKASFTVSADSPGAGIVYSHEGSQLLVVVPKDWIKTVYAWGLAIFEGDFVLRASLQGGEPNRFVAAATIAISRVKLQGLLRTRWKATKILSRVPLLTRSITALLPEVKDASTQRRRYAR